MIDKISLSRHVGQYLVVLTVLLFSSGCTGLGSPKRLIQLQESMPGISDTFEGCAGELEACKGSASRNYDYCRRMQRAEDTLWGEPDILTSILIRENCNEEYLKCAASFDRCLVSFNAAISDIVDGAYISHGQQRSTYALRGRSLVKGRGIVVPVTTEAPAQLKFVLPVVDVQASIPVSVEDKGQQVIVIEKPGTLSIGPHPISVHFADGSNCDISVSPSWRGLKHETLDDFVFDCF